MLIRGREREEKRGKKLVSCSLVTRFAAKFAD